MADQIIITDDEPKVKVEKTVVVKPEPEKTTEKRTVTESTTVTERKDN